MWRLAILFAVPVFTNSQCTGGSSGPSPSQCDQYVGQGTPAGLATTPRADPTAEKLAIEMAGGFTADPDVYDRVVVDLTELERLHFADDYLASTYGDQLLLFPDATTRAAIGRGDYHAWDCANERYHESDRNSWDEVVVLRFDGIYDDEALASEYAAMPGVLRVEALTTRGDHPDYTVIYLCGEIDDDGSTYHYVMTRVRDGSEGEEAFYYTSTPDGAVHYQDTWQTGFPAPPWPTRCGSELLSL